jgi:hypothetical protein
VLKSILAVFKTLSTLWNNFAPKSKIAALPSPTWQSGIFHRVNPLLSIRAKKKGLIETFYFLNICTASRSARLRTQPAKERPQKRPAIVPEATNSFYRLIPEPVLS